MKYRLLKIGDIVKEGDQVNYGSGIMDTDWRQIPQHYWGSVIRPNDGGSWSEGYYRRPIKKSYKVIL